MRDPKAIRKAIMTAKNIAAMIDPHFARVPLPDIGQPAPDMLMPEPEPQLQQFAAGGGVDDHVVNNPMSVFPKPQRMFDEDMPGGAYLSMPDKQDVTGHRAAQASIGIGEGGKPYFHASRDEVDETGTPGKGSALVKTNLFKQRAGWRWLDAPEGHENTATIVSVEHRGNHHYVLDAHFPNGVELSRYPDAPSEPRLRPTTRGNVELGPQVGSILVRGREHPVHSHAIVREYGGRVGYADGGMSDDDDQEIIGYHGSANEFPEFNMAARGRGQGQAAFGEGHNFAEDEDVARRYRRMTARDQMQGDVVHKRTGEALPADAPEAQLFKDAVRYGERDLPHAINNEWPNAISRLEKQIEDAEKDRARIGNQDFLDEYIQEHRSDIENYKRAIEVGKTHRFEPKGYMYEVGLRLNPSKLLKWHEPVEAQPEAVQRHLVENGIQPKEGWVGRDIYRRLAEHPENVPGQYFSNKYSDKTANQTLSDLGVHGIQWKDTDSQLAPGRGKSNYTIWDDSRIKVRKRYALGGMPDDDGTPDYTAPDSLGLYSHAAATAASLPQAKASPAEFRGMLANKGVKPAEFEESGYDQAFAGQPQVTRQQVAAHFHENRTPIVEKSFREEPPKEEEDAFNATYAQPYYAARDRLTSAIEEGRKTGVNQYVDPTEEFRGLQRDYEEKGEAFRKNRGLLSNKYKRPFHEGHMLPGGENYREVLLKHGGDDILFGGVNAHFEGEPNILTHLLMKDRTDTEGKKVLHLDEKQSDWAQQGRKQGFNRDPDASKKLISNFNDYSNSLLDRALGSVSERAREKGLSQEDTSFLLDAVRMERRPELLAYHAGGEGEAARYNQMREAAENARKGISTAPYVTNTNDWVDLGLKRALWEAAKGGYDKLAWSPGQTVADRYNLSKYISAIHHEKNEDGTYNLHAIDHNGYRAYAENDVPEEKMEETFGKEIASKVASGEGANRKELQAKVDAAKKEYEDFKNKTVEEHLNNWRNSGPDFFNSEEELQDARKILTNKMEEDPYTYAYNRGYVEEHEALHNNLMDARMAMDKVPYAPGRDWRSISGLDLEFGGEGMKKFYNDIIPKRAMVLAKKHDPEAKFSTSTVKHPVSHTDYDQGDTQTDLHALDVTPRMRESILKNGFVARASGGEVEGYADGGDVGGYRDPETQHISDWNWRPVEDVQESLGGLKEIPSHVEKFGDFMDNIAQRAAGSGLTPRDLIKAYTITRSSIQRRAADVDRLRASGLALPEEMTGKIRPEGAFGEWLHTPAGQAYLDAAEKGKIHQTAIRNAVQVMAPFGRHQTDIPDALTWAALNLPGKEKQVSELVHSGHLMASTPEEWRAFTQHIRGVGPSKSGFLASLMGRGDQPTLDARQIILHTGRPTSEASKYIAKKGGAGGVEAVDRLSARQSAMDLSLPDRLKPYYQHLAHHAVWDKAGGDETTHEDVVRAMHHAASGGAQNADNSILSHPVAKIFQTIGMAGLGDANVDPDKFKEYLKRAQYALARKITTKGSDVLAANPGAANVKMSDFGKPLEEMESTALSKNMMLPRKEADLEEMQRRKARIFPFLGDLSPADRILLRSGPTALTDPSEQQGGSEFMRSEFAKGADPAAYGNRIAAAKTLAKKIATQTPEGRPAIGTHVAMGLGSVDSSHHAYEPILRMIPNSPIAQRHVDEFDEMMRQELPATKQHPIAWPGIMNTKEAEQFFASRPGTHASFFVKKIDSSKWQKAGFPDVGEARFSASNPELLGSPRLTTGHAFSEVEPSGRVIENPDLKHKTYPALIPSTGEGYLGGSSNPIPSNLMFRDFYKTLKTKDKSGKAIDYDSPSGQTLAQQSLMTKVPYQDATQEWLDGIMEDRRQKQERGFKKGGKVRSALMIAKGLKKS